MIGSSLATKQLPLTSGFTSGRSGQKICRITPHHAVGNLTIDRITQVLKSSNISATYVIQDSNIGQCISESDRPWTSSSATNDNQAITVEIANSCSAAEGDKLGWPISGASLESFICLAVDVMKRYDFAPLVPGENLTWHNMFAATVCPGPYLMSKMQYIADECNKRAFPTPETSILYGVVKQVIALSDQDKAKAYAAKLNAQGETDAYYKVIEVTK